MKTMVVVQVAAILILGVGAGWSQESCDEVTSRIIAELDEINPEAARVFSQACEAYDQLDFYTAEILYWRVLQLEPEFHHAKRRLVYMMLHKGLRDEALTMTKELLSVEQSPENLAARIDVLVGTDSPARDEVKEAVGRANQLMAVETLEAILITSICDAAIADENQLLLHQCVARLERVAPGEIPTYLYGWTLDLANGHPDLAEAKLESARERGLDQETFEELMAVTRSARPPLQRMLSFGWKLGAVWLAGLFFLLAAGFILSRVTLRAATAAAQAPSGAPVGLSLSLRKAYRAVLWLTCGYYFLSVPIVVLAMVGLGAGALLWILSLELIPLKLVGIIVVVVAVSVISMVRSVFVRPRDTDPGEKLDLESEPGLCEVLHEVAGEIDTRPVDSVYLTPGAELAVMERGGLREQMRGRAERCLILGVGVLEGMKLGPFKSVLGHEYGHFSNRDTAGGGFALAVRRSIYLTACGMVEGGAAGWYNPAWIFLNGFNWVFLIVSQGASRLQEILADKWAVMGYGAQQFELGLRHVIDRSIQFDARASAMIETFVETDVIKISPNFYTSPPAGPISEDEIEKAVEAAIHEKTSLADSHPSPVERFEYARSQSQTPTGNLSDCDREVWSLFVDREEIERTMSQVIWRSTGMVSEGEIDVAYA